MIPADRFRAFAASVAQGAGTPWAFLGAITFVAGWGALGPVFNFSPAWQLVVNTTTTIVTFLMMFLLQQTQNRDARAIHLKLDELIRAHDPARNIFADLEDASEAEIEQLQAEFRRLRAKQREPGNDDPTVPGRAPA